MGWWSDTPALVLLALTLASVLLLVEVALPTLGIAGLSAIGLSALGFAAAGDDDPWWPLALVAIAVCVWALLLAARRASPGGQLAGAALFAVGSVGYGVGASDPAAIALGVAGSLALPAVFKPLLRATIRLVDLPPQTGMDSLVGRPGTVVRWGAGAGTVRIDGSLWNAEARGPLGPGDRVRVVGHQGMTLEIAPRASVP